MIVSADWSTRQNLESSVTASVHACERYLSTLGELRWEGSPQCGQRHSRGWGPRLDKKEREMEWIRSIHHPLLPAVATVKELPQAPTCGGPCLHAVSPNKLLCSGMLSQRWGISPAPTLATPRHNCLNFHLYLLINYNFKDREGFPSCSYLEAWRQT